MTNFREQFLHSLVVLDTETTGKDYKTAEIIEAGFVIKNNNKWDIFQELHRPTEYIPPYVQSICYITDEMVADKPKFADVNLYFQKIIDKYDVLVAHNHFYDMRVLQNHGINVDKHQWLCTWRLIKKLTNGDSSVETTSLPYLRFRYKLDVPIEMICHRAGNDSFITALLLEHILNCLEDLNIVDPKKPYLPQIQAWVNDPIIYDIMPFGKHKGLKMVDVPNSYWSWALTNMDSLNDKADNFDPDLLASIEHSINLKSNG